MKKVSGIGSLAVFSLLFFFGCGKKKETKIEQSPSRVEMVAPQVNDESMMMPEGDEMAFSDEMIDEYVFDEEVNLEEFALSDEDYEDSVEVAQADSDLALGWEDDEMMASSEETIAPAIHFVYNYDWVNPAENKNINKVAAQAREEIKAGKKIICEGHCDQMGSPEYNVALSERRANAMKKELVRRGIPADCIEVVGRGQEFPLVATDATTRAEKIAALQANRRVEVKAVETMA